jgi:hypothetical protein
MTSRRDFLRALALGVGAVFVPQFGRWHRQGSGLLVPPAPAGFAPGASVYRVALFTSEGREFSGGGYARQRVAALPSSPDALGVSLPPVTWAALQSSHELGEVRLFSESEGFELRVPVQPTRLNGGDLTVSWPEPTLRAVL